MVSIQKIIDGLCSISNQDFTCDNVYEFLGENPIDIDTVSPFFFWSSKFYTRNLIYRDERFELMAICWEKGQMSKIHNHADQNCWMTVVTGKLRGQNFAIEEFDEEKNYCKLKESDSFEKLN
jgi:predicted metal-dependent enzyme (double-stranded beta helix superfamily)